MSVITNYVNPYINPDNDAYRQVHLQNLSGSWVPINEFSGPYGGTSLDSLQSILSEKFPFWNSPVPTINEETFDPSRTGASVLDSIFNSLNTDYKINLMDIDKLKELNTMHGITHGSSGRAFYMPEQEYINEEHYAHPLLELAGFGSTEGGSQREPQGIYGSSFSDIIAELAHAVQFSTQYSGEPITFPNQIRKDWTGEMGETPEDYEADLRYLDIHPTHTVPQWTSKDDERNLYLTPPRGVNEYKYPGSLEHEAHSQIEPWLEELIFGKVRSSFLHDIWDGNPEANPYKVSLETPGVRTVQPWMYGDDEPFPFGGVSDVNPTIGYDDPLIETPLRMPPPPEFLEPRDINNDLFNQYIIDKYINQVND